MVEQNITEVDMNNILLIGGAIVAIAGLGYYFISNNIGEKCEGERKGISDEDLLLNSAGLVEEKQEKKRQNKKKNKQMIEVEPKVEEVFQETIKKEPIKKEEPVVKTTPKQQPKEEPVVKTIPKQQPKEETKEATNQKGKKQKKKDSSSVNNSNQAQPTKPVEEEGEWEEIKKTKVKSEDELNKKKNELKKQKIELNDYLNEFN
jgi:hypothetical protein